MDAESLSFQHHGPDGPLFFRCRPIELTADGPSLRVGADPTGDDGKPYGISGDDNVNASDEAHVDGPVQA